MALGVLNNLSAIYAENNLNNTSKSLQTVLQQLSSGSKINSGADDAAGLSLVNGLEANSQALMQSETNATEGVGLLEVADGALSQVTSLLDRAITLATEASNGTLNSSQEAAANQEYTSLMSEINNIGSTTTYNQQQVFTGSTVAIYTGDSSTAGSSIDDLKIHTLSESSVGDTDGQMSYSSGQDNVFIDLSNDGHNAAVTDTLNASGATTISVGYISKGSQGALTQATAEISVGSGTNYANTAQGLISAINNSGLGLTATFSTAAAAGAAAAATASAASDGNGSEIDTGIEISAQGIGTGTNGPGVIGALSLPTTDTLGGTLTIVGSDGNNHNITLGKANATDTLANLESTINSAGYGVTATLNQAGTQLTFTTADSKVSVSASDLTQNTLPSSATTMVGDSGLGSLTVGNASDTLSGSLQITEGVDGANTVTPLALGTVGSTDTLANLANTINKNVNYGITATLNSTGTSLSFSKSVNDPGTPAISGSNIEDQALPKVVTGGTLGSMAVASAGDTLSAGTLTITSGLTGLPTTLTLGTTTGTAKTDTLTDLAQTINNGSFGITADLSADGTTLTFTQTSGADTAAISGTGTDVTYTTVTNPISVITGDTLGSIALNGPNDVMSGGTLNVTTASGASEFVVLGPAVPVTHPAATNTLASLANYFNTGAGSSWGITATVTGSTLTFTGSGLAAINESETIPGTPTIDTTPALPPSTNVVAGTGSTLGSLTVLNANEGLTSGTLSIVQGSNGATVPLALGTVGSTDTLANLASTINNTAAYGIQATLSPDGTSLVFTAKPDQVNPPSITSGTVVEQPDLGLGSTLGSLTAGNMSTDNINDTFTGVLTIQEGLDGANRVTDVPITNQTLEQIAQTINNGGYGITATLNQASSNSVVGNTDGGVTAASGGTEIAAGTVLTFTQSTGDKGTASITNNNVILDTAPSGSVQTPTATLGAADGAGTFVAGVSAPNVNDAATIGTNSITAASANSILNGTIHLTAGGTLTFSNDTLTSALNKIKALGAADAGSTLVGNVITIQSVALAADDFSSTTAIGDNTAATLTAATAGDLASGELTINGSQFNLPAGMSQTNLLAAFNNPGGAYSSSGITAIAASATQTDFLLNGNTLATTGITENKAQAAGSAFTLSAASAGDLLSGSMNITSSNATGNVASTYHFTDQTLEQIANSFNLSSGANFGLGITAVLNPAGTSLLFTQSAGALATGTNIADTTLGINPSTQVAANVLLAAAPSDVLSGTLSLTSSTQTGSKSSSYTFTGQTLQEIADSFNKPDGVNSALGITATLDPTDTFITFGQAAGNTGSAVAGSNIIDITPGQTTNTTVATGTTQNTITVANATDTLSGEIAITSGGAGVGTANVTITGAPTLAELADDFNGTNYGAGYQNLSTYGLTANVVGNTLTFSQALGDAQPTGSPNLPLNSPIATVTTDTANPLIDTIALSTSAQTFDSSSVGNIVNSLTVGGASDQLTGTLNITEGADGNNTHSTYNLAGQTLSQVAAAFTTGSEMDLGITATLNAAGTQLVFTQSAGDLGRANVTDATAIDDTQVPGTPTPINIATVSTGLGSLTTTGSGDLLSGNLVLTEGNAASTSQTIHLGTDNGGNAYTLSSLATAFDNPTGLYTNYGIEATLNTAGTALTFSAKTGDASTPTITPMNYTDQVTGPGLGLGVEGNVTVTAPPFTVSGGTIGSFSVSNANDILGGKLTITNNQGNPIAITLGKAGGAAGTNTDTLSDLAAFFNTGAVGSTYGITAQLTNSGTTLVLADNGATPAHVTNIVSGLANTSITNYTPVTVVAGYTNATTAIGSFSVQNASDQLSGTLEYTTNAGAPAFITLGTAGALYTSTDTLADLAATINTVGGAGTSGLTAKVVGNTISFYGSNSQVTVVNATGVPANNSTIGDTTTMTEPTTVNTLTVGASNETLSGILNVSTSAGGLDSHTLTNQTIAQIAANFNDTLTGPVVAQQNWSGDGITATITNNNTLTLAPTVGHANVTSTNLADTIPVASNTISVETGTMLDTLSVNNATDTLGGALKITSGINGQVYTVPLGTTGSTDNLHDLAKSINTDSSIYGVTATLNTAGTQLTLAQNQNDGLAPSVSGVSITDSEADVLTPSTKLGTITVATGSDTLSGTLTGVEGNGLTPFPPITLGVTGLTDTLSNLAHTINVTYASYGITATLNQAGTQLSFTATNGDAGAPTIGNEGILTDTTPSVQTAITLSEIPTDGVANISTLGLLAIPNTDTLSGSLQIGANTISIGSTDNSASTLAAAINQGTYGVTAAYNSASNTLTFTSANSSLAVNTGNLYETVLNGASPTSVGPVTGGVTTTSGYYSLGISGNIQDTSTVATVNNRTTYGGTLNVGITTDSNGAGGTATMSYSDATGQSLSGTDLLNQLDAASALNDLNVAITDVAGMDGYIGAQINTLQSIGSVLTTQQENVVSAQNALQATDYAAATSAMSKYEILSQTGIAALAQANTVQQEVTKLLQ